MSQWWPDQPGKSQLWTYPPDQPTLGPSDIHVWLSSLKRPAAVVNGFAALLSPDEKAKADRFVFDEDRRNYIVARGCLRSILSRYLQSSPKKIGFVYGEYGKPALAASSAELNFNVAHAGEFALYALTQIGEVGVDLEYIRADFAVDGVAKRFFSPGEVVSLDQFEGPLRDEAFFRCWTRKEAFIKAKKMGLSLELDQFEVSLDAQEPALLHTRWDDSEAARWSLRDIHVGPSYVAALAIEAQEWKLSHFLLT